MPTLVQPRELKLDLPLDRIADFCRRWMIVRLEVFGSALRDDFDASSDVDLLVSYTDDARWSLVDHIGIERRLSELIGRRVDLATRRSIEQGHNWIRRREILSTAKSIYVA